MSIDMNELHTLYGLAGAAGLAGVNIDRPDKAVSFTDAADITCVQNLGKEMDEYLAAVQSQALILKSAIELLMRHSYVMDDIISTMVEDADKSDAQEVVKKYEEADNKSPCISCDIPGCAGCPLAPVEGDGHGRTLTEISETAYSWMK